MRIVFMGTPDFAVPCLQRLLEDGHEVPAVFTQPDKPVGRHAVLIPPPVKQLALSHGIAPIFLTLPPINPANIQHVFGEPTAEDWQWRFEAVNEYIRGQAHIDVAEAFVCPDGVLPTELALDGLHPDVDGKRIIGACVNEHWAEARRDADAQLRAYREAR